MKKKGQALAVLFIALTLGAGLCACSGYEKADAPVQTTEAETQKELPVIAIEEETEAEEEKAARNPQEQERIEKDGMIPSYLTGQMTPVELANRRPLAIMMSNDKAALPNYGINRADVVYEAPVEGGMNRYMAIIEDYDNLERIGSVRSCRTYYTYFSREFEAIYAHFGQSSFALPYLAQMEHINGIEGRGASAFYRTQDRKSPHNAYTSGKKINAAIDAIGISHEYPESYEGHYHFAKEDSPVLLEDGFAASYVRPGYVMNNPWFEYNSDDGLYYRFQYGGPHKGDQGQIAVKNILFQYCHWKYYEPSEYLDINVHTPNAGYYFTNGRGEMVTWEKDGALGVTHYYDKNGQEILLNPGKTWVCIIQTDRMDKAEYYGDTTQ